MAAVRIARVLAESNPAYVRIGGVVAVSSDAVATVRVAGVVALTTDEVAAVRIAGITVDTGGHTWFLLSPSGWDHPLLLISL